LGTTTESWGNKRESPNLSAPTLLPAVLIVRQGVQKAPPSAPEIVLQRTSVKMPIPSKPKPYSSRGKSCSLRICERESRDEPEFNLMGPPTTEKETAAWLGWCDHKMWDFPDACAAVSRSEFAWEVWGTCRSLLHLLHLRDIDQLDYSAHISTETYRRGRSCKAIRGVTE